MTTDQLVQLSGQVELQAASSKGKKKIRILAYTGGVMNVPGWGPTLIDLSGLDVTKSVSVLDGHQNMLNAVLGSGRATVDDGHLLVMARLADTDAASSVLELLDTGVNIQASVGVRVGEVSELAPNTAVNINGRSIKSDRRVTLVKSGILEEVSLLPMGADGNTEVTLAAKRAANSQKGNHEMVENDVVEAEQVDLVQAERDRVAEIEGWLDRWPKERKEAIQAGWTADEARERSLFLIRAARPTGICGLLGTGPASHAPAKSLIASAMLLRAGRGDVAIKSYGERTVNAAADMHCNSLFDICRASLRLEGQDAWDSDRDQLIRASLSTTSLPVGLSDAVNKMALSQYQQAPGSWRLFAKIAPLNDFHAHPFIRPHFGDASMPLVPGGGEIRHTKVSEEAFSVSAETFAEMLTVTRKDIINDNTGLFVQYADALARKAASTVSDLVWEAILGNAESHFGPGNTNLIDDVLSIDGLAAAITAMRKKADASGKPIDIQPRVLVVPPELEALSRQIIRSTEVLGDGTSGGQFGVGTGSPLPDDLQLGIEPRISSSAFTGYSDSAWFVFAGPSDSPVVVGFLNGNDSPTIETIEPPSNTLGMTMRGYIDCGVSLGDHRAAVMSSGDSEA